MAFDFFKRLISDRLAGLMPGIFGVAVDTHAGVSVNHSNALTVSAVWGAVQILSDAIVGLPVHVTSEAGKVNDHPISRLLHNCGDASDYMGAVSFKAAMMFNLGLWGNAYARIERDGSGDAVALHPIASRRVKPSWRGNEFVYSIDGSDTLGPGEMFHVMGPMTLNGIESLSPIDYARNTVGISLALELFAAKFFGQGGNTGGIIETPAMKKEARDNFIETWKETNTGLGAAWKIAALPGGFKFHRTTAEPNEAQALESREHQIGEVARVWRVPPHMLGDLRKASYASIEMQNLEFYQNTIQPYVIRWEAEAHRKLLREREKSAYAVRFNMDAKMRGTTGERYRAYQLGIVGGWLNRNEVRALENLPPMDGGDTFLQPLNMAPTGGKGGGAAAASSPAKAEDQSK